MRREQRGKRKKKGNIDTRDCSVLNRQKLGVGGIEVFSLQMSTMSNTVQIFLNFGGVKNILRLQETIDIISFHCKLILYCFCLCTSIACTALSILKVVSAAFEMVLFDARQIVRNLVESEAPVG